jgi:hypothetical protein
MCKINILYIHLFCSALCVCVCVRVRAGTCVNFTVFLSNAAVVGALQHNKAISTRNLRVCFLLQFNLLFFMKEF